MVKKRGRPAGSKNKGKSQRLMAVEAAKDVRKNEAGQKAVKTGQKFKNLSGRQINGVKNE